jgi:nucleolar protein 56
MKRYCPNLLEITGMMLGAKLIAKAGSLKRLSQFPASTIQVLGAEKALFRHMKTGARPPRHGMLIQHPIVAQAKQKEHGKRARTLADKISIAAKVDYFKGEFIGKKLKKELIDKFGVEF